MTMTSWKRKFYPYPAEEAVGSAKEAVEHSLRKWEGLLPVNMEAHGMRHAQGDPFHAAGIRYGASRTWFDFSTNTCSLCQFSTEPGHVRDCERCPITKATGWPCVSDRSPYAVEDDATTYSPYDAYEYLKDPMPMIRLLRKVLKETR